MTSRRRTEARTSFSDPHVSVVSMIDSNTLRGLDKGQLLEGFSRLVDEDRQNTATLIAYIAEIDRRRLYLEHAYPSMFAFCTERFRMSEAVAARRIRAGRTTCRFPCVLVMIARGELHLTAIHHLAAHLTEENHRQVLRRAKHRTTREIEKLVAELAPKPDVPSSIRALPTRRASMPLLGAEDSSPATKSEAVVQASAAPMSKPKPISRSQPSSGSPIGLRPQVRPTSAKTAPPTLTRRNGYQSEKKRCSTVNNSFESPVW